MRKKDKIHFDHKKNSFTGLRADVRMKLEKTYPGVDITQEVLKMELWLSQHPDRDGSIGFITSWLSSACPKHNVGDTYSLAELTEEMQEYLNDLWKNREYLLNLNTKT